jgi:hypothetical protein
MAEKESGKSRGEAAALTKAPAQPAAERSAESLRQKILFTVVGFVLTGIMGTIVTTYFQERSWSFQNRVAQIDKDTEKAFNTHGDVTELIDARWSATLRMIQALEHNATGDEWKAARDGLLSVNDKWELRHANLSAEVEFYVDSPFGIRGSDKLDPIWELKCITFPLGDDKGQGADPSSARVLLEVSAHCQGLIKDEIEGPIADRDAGKIGVAQKPIKEIIDRSYLRLDHIWHVNDALRCMIVERALAIRRSFAEVSFFDTVLGVATPTDYALRSDAQDCLSDYRRNPKLGLSSLKQK